MTPSENLLCINQEFQKVVKDGAQVFVLLNSLHWLLGDVGGNGSSQLPLPTGEGHHHLFCFFQFQSGSAVPFYQLLKNGSVVLGGAGEQGPENYVASVFHQVAVGMCGSAVIGVEDEEQGGEHTARGGAGGGEAEIQERAVDLKSLEPVGQKVQNPQE